jgi:hypothetical protein
MSAAKDLDKSVRKPSQGILRPAEAALTGAFLICDRRGYSPKKPPGGVGTGRRYGGLGIGTIIVLGLIGYWLGIDPSVLIGGAEILSGGGSSQQQSSAGSREAQTGAPSDPDGTICVGRRHHPDSPPRAFAYMPHLDRIYEDAVMRQRQRKGTGSQEIASHDCLHFFRREGALPAALWIAQTQSRVARSRAVKYFAGRFYRHNRRSGAHVRRVWHNG